MSVQRCSEYFAPLGFLCLKFLLVSTVLSLLPCVAELQCSILYCNWPIVLSMASVMGQDYWNSFPASWSPGRALYRLQWELDSDSRRQQWKQAWKVQAGLCWSACLHHLGNTQSHGHFGLPVNQVALTVSYLILHNLDPNRNVQTLSYVDYGE